MRNNKEAQGDKSKTNVSIKKTYDFFCSRIEWVHCEQHKMTEEEAEKYAKQHNLQFVEDE